MRGAFRICWRVAWEPSCSGAVECFREAMEVVDGGLRMRNVTPGTHNGGMNVFISSLIEEYEQFRAAAAEAIETLGHTVVRAEDFPASPATAQQACLRAVRDADVVVLLLGERYGASQASGFSATHEEYREARERKPVLVFVESGVTPEASQRAFIDEVQNWETGHFRDAFSTPEELKAKVLRALHDHELATAVGPVDESDMVARATALLPAAHGSVSSPQLIVAVAGGPNQQVLRPLELEDPDLARDLQREALFGDHAVLDASDGTDIVIERANLMLRQRAGFVTLDQAGSVGVGQPAQQETDHVMTQLSALIEEDMTEAVVRAIRFAGWLLDRIDSVHRLTDVVVVSRLRGAGYMPWRTRAEHAASPTAAQMGMVADDTTVTLTPARRHRQALAHDAERIAEDLIALLRRARTQ